MEDSPAYLSDVCIHCGGKLVSHRYSIKQFDCKSSVDCTGKERRSDVCKTRQEMRKHYEAKLAHVREASARELASLKSELAACVVRAAAAEQSEWHYVARFDALSARLREVVLWMESEPDARYPKMAAVAEDLKAFLITGPSTELAEARLAVAAAAMEYRKVSDGPFGSEFVAASTRLRLACERLRVLEAKQRRVTS